MIKEYIIQHWALLLILLAFAISLKVSVFLDKKTVNHMYGLILAIFLLSIVVFVEFSIADDITYKTFRIILTAVRYSATPFIIAMVIFAFVKKIKWFIFIPAIAFFVINIVSIFTGIVFYVDDENVFHRGILGFSPFILAGLYCLFLIYILFKRSNKKIEELIPILFFIFSFSLGLILPFVMKSDYTQVFCLNIAIALFVYYIFTILQLTKKDALTGLLNRQAYYADISHDKSSINAILSIDINGLKMINDTYGHSVGDDAIMTIAVCIIKSAKRGQSCYRIGGDEFAVVCRKASYADITDLVSRIKRAVMETRYRCAIGYAYSDDPSKDIMKLSRQSDQMMYIEKSVYYKNEENDRRNDDSSVDK